jgi:hypothetical protein
VIVPVTININKLSLVHQGSGGMAIATLPDVCLTPAPPLPPVPVPYPNIALSADLAQGTTTVFADGGNSCGISPSTFAMSVGDEGGVIGGVVSGTISMEASWLTFSADVKIEGQAATRLTDKMLQNHGNTVCCEGVFNPPVFSPVDDDEVQKLIDELMKENQNNVCEAFENAKVQRNGGKFPPDPYSGPPENQKTYKADCYNHNLAAAEHYLFAKCDIIRHGWVPALAEDLLMKVFCVGYEGLKGVLYTEGALLGVPLDVAMLSTDPSKFLGFKFTQALKSSNFTSDTAFTCPVSPPSWSTMNWGLKGVRDGMDFLSAPKDALGRPL